MVAIHLGVSRINALPPEERWEKYTMCDDDDCALKQQCLSGSQDPQSVQSAFDLGGLAKDLHAIAAAALGALQG